jgi:hypothetical protein
MNKKALGVAIGLLFFCVTAYAGSSTKIEDRTQTGYKADVEKLDTKYGVAVTELPTGTLYNGQVTTNAGTAVALTTSTAIKSVSVKALAANTGIVYVGTSSVSSSNGYELNAGEAIDIDHNDLSEVYIDVSVDGEGACYIAVN